MHFSMVNENDLVARLNNSDGEAFEQLYQLYSGRLFGYLIKLVKSEVFAQELLQDTFIKLWNKRENINPEKSFRSYLFRIAENNVYDFFRKAARDKKLQEAIIKNACENYRHVEENLLTKENEQILQDAINLLPPKRRQIFQLIKIEERSYDEVSALLNISVSTINDHIVKAMKSIREALKQYHIAELGMIFIFLLS
ncbi:MAG TPA: RNA polymerase sigma-70 factor [Hanamia sp.]|nr:RNA polymerase sigma-70 factor [Hanamia sp.]